MSHWQWHLCFNWRWRIQLCRYSTLLDSSWKINHYTDKKWYMPIVTQLKFDERKAAWTTGATPRSRSCIAMHARWSRRNDAVPRMHAIWMGDNDDVTRAILTGLEFISFSYCLFYNWHFRIIFNCEITFNLLLVIIACEVILFYYFISLFARIKEIMCNVKGG